MESSLSEEEQLNQLRLLLYPEGLEQFSKVITILTEELSFKTDSLFQLKEAQKIASTKDELINLLTKLSKEDHNIIEINESKDESKLILTDKYMFYSFVNIPMSYTKDQVITLLNLKESDYTRLYKQSLFWNLISEKQEFNENFEKTLKEVSIQSSDGESKKLKCNKTSSMMLRNALIKLIQHNNYLKETGGLSTGVESKHKNSSGTGKKSSISSTDKDQGSHKMSWRKKSDDEPPAIQVEKDKYYNNSKKNSNVSGGSDYYENDYYGKGKDYYDYGGYGYGKKGNNKNRRQRFKSDPTEDVRNYEYGYGYGDNKNYYGGKNEKPEDKVDLSNVKYPTTIKYKYSNKEIVDFYLKIKDSIKFDKGFFKNYIDDIMLYDNSKGISIIERENLAKEIPKNNPLLNFKINK